MGISSAQSRIICRQAHTRGFSVQNLCRMQQCYIVHTEPEILAPPARKITATGLTTSKSNFSHGVRDLKLPFALAIKANLSHML